MSGQLDVQSAVSASPDLCTVNQSSSDFGCPWYSVWNSPTCRYADGLYAEGAAAAAVGYETAGTPSTAATAATQYMSCNVQQRLVCGGNVRQFHSPGGVVFNDAVQPRTLSDISGMSFHCMTELRGIWGQYFPTF